MRIKFLSVIMSFLLMSIAISSCLNSDDNYEYSSDATIRAFGLDTIKKGIYYKFTIDQLKREIYNVDSLPVGSDTIIDKILIDTLNVTGWVTSGLQDTLFNNLTDSVNLREPITLKVHAADRVTTREYKITVNVHKQDPDSLIWREMSSLPTSPAANKQKLVILKNDAEEENLFVYTSTTSAYRSSLGNPAYLSWNAIEVTGMPANVDLGSIVSFKNQLFVAAPNGDIFCSNNGSTWVNAGIQEVKENKEVQNMQMSTLVATLKADALTGISEETLIGILLDGGQKYFCISTDGKNWTRSKETVSNDFPVKDIYATVFTNASGIKQTVVVGKTETSAKAVVPWFTMDGLTWADMSTPSDFYCPAMENPAIMYYGGLFHMMGGKFETIYSSRVGIAWNESAEKFKYPMKKIVTPGEDEDDEEEVTYESLFKDKGDYSLTIDKNHYIWIVWNDGSVWRGRLNKLGFKIQ